jgi:type IX secretion system PorP/SprF family membrane protein
MKCIQLLVILLLAAVSVDAQQLNASSFYEMYGVLHNPAAAGTKYHASLGGTFRSQWEGMPGGPQTGLIFGSTYLKKSKLGLGGYVYNDVTGPTRRTGLQTAISYHIFMNDNKAALSFGLEGRFQQFSYDKERIGPVLGNDPVVAGSDNTIKGDAGFGIAYTTSDFQLGVSAAQLIQSQLGFYEGAGNPTEEAKLYRHYYLHSNYNWDVDQTTRIIPNLLLIYLPNAPLEVQGGARVEHSNTFWYGLAYRARQAWMISAGVRIKGKFNIGYSFDIYKTPLSIYDNGSNGHEIMLRYDFIK